MISILRNAFLHPPVSAVFLGKLLLIFSSIVTDMLPIETACLPPLLSLLVMKDGQTHLGGLVCIGF